MNFETKLALYTLTYALIWSNQSFPRRVECKELRETTYTHPASEFPSLTFKSYLVNGRFVCSTSTAASVLIDLKNFYGCARFVSTPEFSIHNHTSAKLYANADSDAFELLFLDTFLGDFGRGLLILRADTPTEPLAIFIHEAIADLMLRITQQHAHGVYDPEYNFTQDKTQNYLFFLNPADGAPKTTGFLFGPQFLAILQNPADAVIYRRKASTNSFSPEHLVISGEGKFKLELGTPTNIGGTVFQRPVVIFDNGSWSANEQGSVASARTRYENPAQVFLTLADSVAEFRDHLSQAGNAGSSSSGQ